MIRVKDIQKSLKFYQDILGMSLMRTHESQAGGFNLYFLGYPGSKGVSAQTADREGLLELTWNHGTENDPDFKYHDGNSQPQGFGHICEGFHGSLHVSCPGLRGRGANMNTGVSVDSIEAACQRFEELGCSWKKRLTDGRMKNVAFLLDPDGYWVEVVQNERFTGKENF
jgi:lactoylglutathione lyase